MSHKSSASTHQCSFLQRLFTARRKRRRDTRRTLLLEQVEARTLFNADFGVAHNSPLLADPAEVASSEVQACVVTSELIQQATSTILENSGAWTPQISSAWFGFVVPSEPREVSVGKISAGPSLATIQWQGKSTKVIERDWIIQFSQEKAAHVRSLADVSATLDSIGLRAERVRGLGMKGLVSVTLSSGIDAGQVVAALNDDARVSFFEPATIVESLALPDDPRFADQTQDYQTAAFSLGVPAAWDITTGSQDVVIGLLDTGFDFEHVDLRDNAWDGTADGNIIHGKDFVNSDDSPQDDNGHGTHVAGIIGAQGNNGIGTTGVAWNVSLLGLKVLDADGTGSNADIAAGINYATMLRQNGEANVRVLNASFASSLPSDAISNSIRAAGEAGIMLVTAAGNFGEDIDAPTHQSFPAEYPHDNIIVVANVQSDGALTSSSNYGDTEVDLAAPGMSILSTARGDGYAELSGTSMSAPVVSGALALGWSIAPNATPAELKRALLNSVTTTDSLAGKLVSGGIINVEGFLRSVVNLYGGGGQDGPLYDLGDAPESYATRLSEDGARHLATGPTLGSLRDADSTGYPSEDSRGDDMNGLDDEDGVKWSAFSIGQQNAVVTVTVRGAEDNAKLDAWIDFNHNGHWEADEQIADSVLVVNGSNQVMFDIPRTTLEGTTHSRFRLSTDGNLGVTGPAFDGEVEDYLVTIVDSRPQQIVRGSKETVLGRAGETIEFGVQYSTSDEDNTLSGLGLRLHYDSSIVTFEQLHNVYATNLVQQQGPRADTSNFDGDAATDKYVLIAWSDPFGGSWPNADLPANLFNASFKFAADLPIGTPATIHLTASSSAASHDFLGQDIHLIVAPNVSLDVDDNCRADALSDGVITLRYLFGFTGAALVEGALPPGARRTDPADIAEFLDAGRDTMLDVDGNGVADALTDGIMTFRYLFGFQGAELVQNALGAGATRTDPTEIVEFLDSFLPICPVTQSTIAAIGGGGGRSLIAGDPSQQIVIPSESQLAVTAAGDSFSFDVDYSTASPLDATLTGLGLRMHFDSDRLELQNIPNVLGKNFVQQQGPLNDTSDFDGDAETDKYVLFAWSDPFGGNWPGALPATLFSPTFEATSGFTSGETRINFSASSTAAGFGFDGTTVVVSMAPENMAPTFTSFDGPIQSADEDQTVEVTFANLVAHGNEQDTDGSVQAFVVKSVVGGTLRIGADQFSATPFEAGVNV